MPALTPEERRGALTIVLLFALGAAHDLWRARHPRMVAPLPSAASSDAAASDTTPPVSSGVPTRTAAGPQVDINHAGVSELDALPGIGPVLARRIVAERDRRGGFRAPEDLLSVQGIGPKLYARLRPQVRVVP